MGDPPEAAVRALVRGRVQGVGFRDYVENRARTLRVTGFVRNLSDGRTVEVVAEGPREALERLVAYLRDGPSGAHVIAVETDWREPTGAYDWFSVAY